MLGNIANFLSVEAKKRLSVFSTAAAMTVRPSVGVIDLRLSEGGDVHRALRYFLSCVAIILAIEAVFSFVFDTAFSDLVHHLYPVFVALLGVLTVYLFLMLTMTPNITFAGVSACTLYVGGTALLVMIVTIFVLLSFDFATNYQSVMSSSCKHRTIMCLLSGDSQTEYGAMQRGKTTETQGWSFSYILLLILGTAIYYSHVLSSVLKAAMNVARWRTYLSSFLSFVVLAPACLLLINAIYRLIYD